MNCEVSMGSSSWCVAPPSSFRRRRKGDPDELVRNDETNATTLAPTVIARAWWLTRDMSANSPWAHRPSVTTSAYRSMSSPSKSARVSPSLRIALLTFA